MRTDMNEDIASCNRIHVQYGDFCGLLWFLKAQFTLKNDQIKGLALVSNPVWLFLSDFFPYNETE